MAERESDRRPLIVGIAQAVEHDPQADPEKMLCGVAAAALADSGAGERLRERIEAIGAVESLSWPVPDPAAAIAAALEIEPRERVLAPTAGTAPIELLADSCRRIAAGELDVVLIAGVECFDALIRAQKEGREPGFTTQPEDAGPDRTLKATSAPSHPVETAAGLLAPVAYYPLFESVVRASAGRAPDAHQRRLGELWARFAAVSAENPHAWSQQAHEPERIAQPTPDNRLVSIPYTKLMNSNIQTNQAAALLLCSRRAAEEAGVDPARGVAVRASAAASDHEFPCERERLDRSPALAACAGELSALTGIAIEEVEHLDIYSCFPSAVAVAARELGIDPLEPARAPTVTGGLSFAGGPGSNYVTHSLAALVERIRERGGRGLATGVGWYLTKHGVVLLEPAGESEEAYAHLEPQAAVDAGVRVRISEPPDAGEGRIEAYTAICDRGGDPELGIATFLLEDGSRTAARAVEEQEILARFAREDLLGAPVAFTGDRRFRLR